MVNGNPQASLHKGLSLPSLIPHKYDDTMSIKIKMMQLGDEPFWDAYVRNHANAVLYHLSGWKDVIEKTYGHKSYYLIALKDGSENLQINSDYQLSAMNYELDSHRNPIAGILPLFHLKHFLFGNSLVSIPFFDMAGILTNDEGVEKALISEAVNLGNRLGVDQIELRQSAPLSCFAGKLPMNSQLATHNLDLSAENVTIRSYSSKARMLLPLPDSPEKLMKSFKSKLRSQVKRPMKEGLRTKVGGVELLEDFYKVFLINMRDLGSPVHSKNIMKHVLEVFAEQSKIIVIYNKNEPLACSMICAHNNVLQNPWSSALRQYSTLSANMFLYWKMLEYACKKGLEYFDFGRSTPGEGTYKFKEQWGAKPAHLFWYYISLNDSIAHKTEPERERFEKAINYWKKLPIPVTRILGPIIRKHIAL
jgi:serine/alanine adding enzyme